MGILASRTICAKASDVASAKLDAWSEGIHLVSCGWSRIKDDELLDGVII